MVPEGSSDEMRSTRSWGKEEWEAQALAVGSLICRMKWSKEQSTPGSEFRKG